MLCCRELPPTKPEDDLPFGSPRNMAGVGGDADPGGGRVHKSDPAGLGEDRGGDLEWPSTCSIAITCLIRDGHPQVGERLQTLPPEDRVLTSVVNVAEMLRGIHLLPEGRRKRELLSHYRRVIGRMEEILSVTQTVAER